MRIRMRTTIGEAITVSGGPFPMPPQPPWEGDDDESRAMLELDRMRQGRDTTSTITESRTLRDEMLELDAHRSKKSRSRK